MPLRAISAGQLPSETAPAISAITAEIQWAVAKKRRVIMARQKYGPKLQPYPRVEDSLLAKPDLFPLPKSPMNVDAIAKCVDAAFARCNLKKSGKKRSLADSPEKLVNLCIEHLKTRSDPIISPYFVSFCNIEDLF
jgi:hypothetical protein